MNNAATSLRWLFSFSPVAWLIPTSAELFGVNSRQISTDQVISKTKTWVLLNYLFQVLGIVAFLSGLRALSTRATEANV